MKRRFTLIEILTVLAIVAVVLGLVMPRVLRVPKRLQVEGARTRFVSALRECAVRAIASGRTIQVRLDGSGQHLMVTTARAELDALSDSKLPEGGAGGTAAESAGLVVSNRSSYPVPDSVTWEDLDQTDEERLPVFTFYPDGGASGPELVYVVAERRFSLRVDRLTSRPEIRELTN